MAFPIIPIGELAFPVGFAEGGYGTNIPVISASHVGRGKMLGYGHESWVDGHGEEETEFSYVPLSGPVGRMQMLVLLMGPDLMTLKTS